MTKDSDVAKAFPVGAAVDVIVLEVDSSGRRIRLSRKAVLDAEETAEIRDYSERADAKPADGFGSLADKLRMKAIMAIFEAAQRRSRWRRSGLGERSNAAGEAIERRSRWRARTGGWFAIEAAQGLIVVTGAGISLASGIRPSAAAARRRCRRATSSWRLLRFFTSDPAGASRWFRERFLRVSRTRPIRPFMQFATLRAIGGSPPAPRLPAGGAEHRHPARQRLRRFLKSAATADPLPLLQWPTAWARLVDCARRRRFRRFRSGFPAAAIPSYQPHAIGSPTCCRSTALRQPHRLQWRRSSNSSSGTKSTARLHGYSLAVGMTSFLRSQQADASAGAPRRSRRASRCPSIDRARVRHKATPAQGVYDSSDAPEHEPRHSLTSSATTSRSIQTHRRR